MQAFLCSGVLYKRRPLDYNRCHLAAWCIFMTVVDKHSLPREPSWASAALSFPKPSTFRKKNVWYYPLFVASNMNKFDLKMACIYYISNSCCAFVFFLCFLWSEDNSGVLEVPLHWKFDTLHQDAVLMRERDVSRYIYYGCVRRHEGCEECSWSKDIPALHFPLLHDTFFPPFLFPLSPVKFFWGSVL